MSSLLAELRRRNVFKVAVAYAIVGWLVVQAAAILLPTFEAPSWVMRVIVLLLAIGFVIALTLAWAYELTPGGTKRTTDSSPPAGARPAGGQGLNYAITVLLGVAVLFLLGKEYLVAPTVSAPTPAAPSAPAPAEPEDAVLPNSIAVLPLENLSPDPDNAYFAAGMHEEILNQLAKLRNLNVISRTSVVRYANSELSVPEIAHELNVKTVMEGSVRYANNRVLVTMQLIDPETDVHLWSDSYNRDLADVFAIQADIAMNVANALLAEFSEAEQDRIEAVPTVSPEAYAIYLRARAVSPSDAAIELFDKAIRLDPDFALAYASKALDYANGMTGNRPDRQAEIERMARESAEQALALDPTLGGAHAALAFVHQAHWRWNQAEAEFEQALRLSPNDADILSQYSRMKRYRGEYDAALEAGRRAAELDPQNPGAHYFLGICYRYARQYDAAAESFRTALRLEPSPGNFHAQLAFTQISQGNWGDAAAELRVAEQLYGDNIGSIRIPQLANAYAQMGQPDQVERLFAALKVRAEDSPVNAALWALMYIALEDYDQALKWLQIAVDDQAPDLVPLGDIKGNPYANPVLDEPRFKELRDRIGT